MFLPAPFVELPMNPNIIQRDYQKVRSPRLRSYLGGVLQHGRVHVPEEGLGTRAPAPVEQFRHAQEPD